MSDYRIEFIKGGEIVRHVEAWRALAARALEKNVFYEPAFLLATLARDDRPNLMFFAVWRDSETPRLALLWPLMRPSFGAVWRGFADDYVCLGPALVDRDEVVPALSRLLDAFCRRRRNLALIFPQIRPSGAFHTALTAEARQRGLAIGWRQRESRAALDTTAAASKISVKRRKNWARLRRRLAERGAIAVETDVTPEKIALGLKIFLDLEAKGWKGLDGGAFLRRKNHAEFLRRLGGQLAMSGQCRLYRLMCGDQTIACHILLADAHSGFFWKTAYDEAFAAFSPGVLLTLEMSSLLRDDGWRDIVDSCALPDHPMIDRLWRQRLEVGDLVVAKWPAIQKFLRIVAIGQQWARGVRMRVKTATRPPPRTQAEAQEFGSGSSEAG